MSCMFADRMEPLKPAEKQRLALQFVEEMREERVNVLSETVSLATRGPLYWILGGVFFCIAAVATPLYMVHSSRAPALPPRPRAEIVAPAQSNPCIERMQIVARAVADYTEAKGSPPSSLAELRPDFMTVEPIDPMSGKPFIYRRDGNLVSVACPPAAPEHRPEAARLSAAAEDAVPPR